MAVRARYVSALMIAGACNLLACTPSRKLVVMKLDDSIATAQQGLLKAKCDRKVPISAAEAQFAVQTAYTGSIGAPIGAVPVTIGLEAGLTESSQITVTYGDLPCEGAAAMLELAPAKPQLYQLDRDTLQLQPLN